MIRRYMENQLSGGVCNNAYCDFYSFILNGLESGRIGYEGSSVYMYNAARNNKLEYTDQGKLLFEGKETFGVDASGDITLAGHKIQEFQSKVDSVSIPPDVWFLTSQSTEEEIIAAWGSKQKLIDFVKNYDSSKIYMIHHQEEGGGGTYIIPVYFIVDYVNDDEFTYSFEAVMERQYITQMCSLYSGAIGIMASSIIFANTATPTTYGLMSPEDKQKLDRQESSNYTTNISNINTDRQCTYVSLTSNGTLNARTKGTECNGKIAILLVHTPSSVTITIPTTGDYISMCGSSYTTKANSYTKFQLTGINGKWLIEMVEQK